jgi:hypothetical protein
MLLCPRSVGSKWFFFLARQWLRRVGGVHGQRPAEDPCDCAAGRHAVLAASSHAVRCLGYHVLPGGTHTCWLIAFCRRKFDGSSKR